MRLISWETLGIPNERGRAALMGRIAAEAFHPCRSIAVAESISLTVNISSQIAEVLAPEVVPAAAAASDRTVNHNAGGVNRTILDTETPHPVACLTLAIEFDGSGEYEVNLRAAPTTGAPDAGEDLVGKRLMHIELETSQENVSAVLIKPAASNGYHLWGNTFELSLQPFANLAMLCRSQLLSQVGSATRVIRFEGTIGDRIDVKMCFQ